MLKNLALPTLVLGLVVVGCWSATGAAAKKASAAGNATYDEDFAREMLILSAGAYGTQRNACIDAAFSSDSGWQLHSESNATCDAIFDQCAYYIVANDAKKRLAVVFRGTNTPQQMLMEFLTAVMPMEDFNGRGNVSKYFYDSLNVLWGGIYDVLARDKYLSYTVTFTGHSLGGALAALCAAQTALLIDRVTDAADDRLQLYTFGEPRVGNPQFAETVNQLIPVRFRVIHSYDWVPHVPPCRLTLQEDCDPDIDDMPFHHGVEIWYPDTMASGDPHKVCYGEDPSCSNGRTYNLTLSPLHAFDHGSYFQKRLPLYGNLGCQSL